MYNAGKTRTGKKEGRGEIESEKKKRGEEKIDTGKTDSEKERGICFAGLAFDLCDSQLEWAFCNKRSHNTNTPH